MVQVLPASPQAPEALGEEDWIDDGEAQAAAELAAAERREADVDGDWHGQRLDRWLVQLAPEFSRNHLQSLIERECVTVHGQLARSASRKLLAGQRVSVTLLPTEESRAFRAEDIALDIVFEDEHLMVVNKPVGMVVHPAAGNWSGTLMNAVLHHHKGAGSLPRAGIVHRLDKDTSGLMVVGKSLPAVTALVRMIGAREVHREYLALAHGRVAEVLNIDAPLRRDPASRIRMAVLYGGKPARTDVYLLAVAAVAQGSISALQCVLHSGRTHQIRVHLAHKGHPLVADALYGGAPAAELQRQALHAARLSFAHPVSGQTLRFDAPLPQDLSNAWQILGLPAPVLADHAI